MSWRQAESRHAAITMTYVDVVQESIVNDGHLARSQRLEKAPRGVEIEPAISGLDAEKETVPARQRETRHVEHGVIRHRQAVERQHAQDRRERGAQDRALER